MSLIEQLQQLWQQEPSLKPDPSLHDYQLTYPPAVMLEQPEFARVPSAFEYQQAGIGAFKAAAYYFHFGFCQYRCRYCFHYELKTVQKEEEQASYIKALIQEMKTVASLTRSLKTGLYFLGGGTPTALPEALIERFLNALLSIFGPPPTTMSTIEAKPITATDTKLKCFVEAGFRRINLGVQSLDPTLYAHHHFGEPLSVALDAIERARNIGFSYINIDLMTGLAGQTPTSWKLTLNTLKKLAESGAIDSVFIYPYHDDPRSSSFNKPLQLPDALETARTDAVAREMMESLGWSELGARFYRSPRHMRRELWELAKTRINPAYGEVLYHGFGNSSFSIGDRATWLNHRSLSDYCKAVEQHGLGISHFVPLTDAQRATRDLTFDLLYSPITRVRSRIKKYGAEAMTEHQQKLMRWEELGLGKHNRLLGTFSLTPLGKLAQLQLIPQHYLAGDHTLFSNVMLQRKEAGKKYRGY